MRGWLLFIVVSLLWLTAQPAMASVSSCTAASTPHSVQTSTSQTYTITLNNTGSTPILYFKISSPSPLITIQGKDAAGWAGTSNSEEAQFWGGTISPGSNLVVSINANSGLSEMGMANWSVVANDVLSADGVTGCSGDLGLEISGIRDVTPPVISETVTISDVTSDAVKVSWTTSEPARSQIHYGLMDAFDQSVAHDEFATDHAVAVTNLLPDTTYSFHIVAIDSSGNTVESDNAPFTTARAGLTSEPQVVTITQTITSVVTQYAPTPTEYKTETKTEYQTITVLIRDETPPSVSFSNKWEKFYSQPPPIKGLASDNKMIAALEYTIDGGKSWRPLEAGTRKASVSFSFEPPITEEGDYKVAVRAYDAEGNRGTSLMKNLVIDRLPPTVGAIYAAWGPGLPVPTAADSIITMVGLPLHLSLSAAGGPISMRATGAGLPQNLTSDSLSNRWFGTFTFPVPGKHDIVIDAVDGFNRATTSTIASVNVVSAGTISDQHHDPVAAGITVWHRSPVTGNFSHWDGQPYNQLNPQSASAQGEFGLILPPGTYYLSLEKPGYAKKTSDIFTLRQTGLVRAEVQLPVLPQVKLGPFTLVLPSLWQRPFTVSAVAASGGKHSVFADFLNRPLPEMEWYSEQNTPIKPVDWLGQPTLLTLEAPWLPSVSRSLTYLADMHASYPSLRTAWIASQNSSAALQGIRARIGDGVSLLVADRDSQLTEYFHAHRLPVTVLLDRLGTVRAVEQGTISQEVIQQVVEE